MVEQLICNQKVPSSILGVGTNKIKGLAEMLNPFVFLGATLGYAPQKEK